MEPKKEPCARVNRFVQCLKHLGYDVSWADSARVVAQGHHEFQVPVQFLACETHLVVRGRKVVGEHSPTLHSELLSVANRLNCACRLLRVTLSGSSKEDKSLAIEADANLPTDVSDREFREIFSLWVQELAWVSKEFLGISQPEAVGVGL